MPTVIPAVMQAATNGSVNWAAVASATVGVAGIIGMFWSGKRAREAASKDLLISINSEDKRAKRAEKRQIYARHLATCGEEIRVRYFSSPDQKQDIVPFDYAAACLRAVDTASEVELIAPADIRKLASHLASPAGPDDYRNVREQLLRAMRADLGEEPGEPVKPVSSLGHQLARRPAEADYRGAAESPAGL